MEGFPDIEIDDVIRDNVGNRDIYGFRQTAEGQWVFDRSYTPEGMARRGLLPRNADLSIAGPDVVTVPDYLVKELGLEK